MRGKRGIGKFFIISVMILGTTGTLISCTSKDEAINKKNSEEINQEQEETNMNQATFYNEDNNVVDKFKN
ncbi:MAG: hypothetical protein ACRCTZ_21230 [Sarcina sp.]